MKGIGLELRPYQKHIIENVIKNVENGNRMQAILLPNTYGKTSMSFVLSILFTEMKKKVLYYCEGNMDKQYASDAIKTDINRFNGVDFGDKSIIDSIMNNHYDIIITDAITASFDDFVLSNFAENVKGTDVDSIKKLGRNASTAQKSLLSLHYLQQMIERDDSFVISFDLNNKFKDIGYTPIIVAPHFLSYKMDDDEKKEYELSCADAYESVIKKKIETIEALSASESSSFDKDAFSPYLDEINKKLDALQSGQSDIKNDLSAIQNDVSRILSSVEEINNTTKRSKDVLDIYFSVHGNEDNQESDLFVSRLVNRLADDISEKIKCVETQRKYQQTRKLVMIRLGDEAWDKLDDSSKKFLITAKFMFEENMDLEESIDYSSICLLSSKAVEVELAKRFVIGYEKYLDEEGVSDNKFPKGVMIFNKRKNRYEKMRMGDFTLGSCPYIMGILGNEDERKENRSFFEKYCKERLLKQQSQVSINDRINEFNGYIRYVKENFRNPAAHKETMSISEASGCLDYILEVERVLKKMLNQFNF